MFRFTCMLLLLSCVSCGLLPRSKISLENNGYRGILIAINEDVAESPALVERLQEIFTEASEALYTSTHSRTFFEEITILLPKTWSNAISNISATGEVYDAANVIVTNHENVGRETPYTSQFGSCGEEAEYIHLTDKFIVDNQWTLDTYGDPKKVIVHEWGHLRWGLFDEYGTKDGEYFYLNEKGHVEPTRCSEYVIGKEYDFLDNRCNLYPAKGNLPDKDCRFKPIPNIQQATGSYMFMSFLESVVEFCHSDPNGDKKSLHNPMAPNQQNIQCSYRSAWDVMLESQDFRNNNNPSREVVDTTPTFRIVKSSPLRIVLVLDISGSMSSNNRISTLNQVATKYIRSTVPDGHFVSIVEFHTSATITANLTELQTTQDRDSLAYVLPTTTLGTTCIGCGLQTGIQALEDGGRNASGGIILLITDGGENVNPYINDVKPTLIRKRVRVDTIAFGNYADEKLQSLSLDTGGQDFLYNEGVNDTGLSNALTATVTSRLSGSSEVPLELHSAKKTIPPYGELTSSVFIDATIGKDTQMFFFWSTSHVSVVVYRPNGSVINDTCPEYTDDVAKKTVVIKISGIAEPGEWIYKVSGGDQVEISIQSVARENTQPIRVTTSTSASLITETPAKTNIYAQVFRGYTPILKVTVTATVERPSPHDPINVRLLDNGAGADVTKGDGVYSGIFLDFVTATCPNCRYNIKVTAEDKDGVAEVPAGSFSSSRALPISPPDPVDETTNQTEHVGQFTRVASGGVIQAPVTIPPGDNFPPSRITDLRVVDTSYGNQTITLAWTAPGNDLDRGTADEYELRFSKNFSSISQNFTEADELTNQDIVDGNLTTPKAFGEDEIYAVQMLESDQNVTYFFSVRARDENANEGLPSNIISVAIVYDYPDAIPSTPPPTAITSTSAPNEVVSDDDKASILLPVVITCSVAVAIFVCSLVAIALAKVLCSKRKYYR